MLILLIVALWLGPSASKDFVVISNVGLTEVYSAIVDSAGVIFAAGIDGNNGGIGRLLRSTSYGMTGTEVLTSPVPMYDIVSATIEGTTYHIALDWQGTIYVSTNGGISWITVPPANLSLTYLCLAIGSNGIAYQLASAELRIANHTTNFAKWAVPFDVGNLEWRDVSTFDGVNVIVVGVNGAVRYSTDSFGTSALIGPADTGTSEIIRSVAHYSSLEAFAAGTNGYFAKTTDGGVSWTTINVYPGSYGAWFHAIQTVSPMEAYVAVYQGSIGAVYRTTDMSTWTLFSNTSIRANTVAIINAQFGVVGGQGDAAILTLLAGSFSLPILVRAFLLT